MGAFMGFFLLFFYLSFSLSFFNRWLGKKNFFGEKFFAFGSSVPLLPHASAVDA